MDKLMKGWEGGLDDLVMYLWHVNKWKWEMETDGC
jgi:hypothetical protein